MLSSVKHSYHNVFNLFRRECDANVMANSFLEPRSQADWFLAGIAGDRLAKPKRPEGTFCGCRGGTKACSGITVDVQRPGNSDCHVTVKVTQRGFPAMSATLYVNISYCHSTI